ncbi:hypothetical protein TPHA_0B03150 [Tetrapisispora phaffii CBS 4417]|uniref:N-acetyltransferase domain-containing protein n=1 Tax=Tetrapisispora phaffii (strain ATCC 24235 / CBS 4417 / NBRC 1672 / NRRL Y-8282 / UCD 70-5) TaxID=1071381 RepID=G8BPQ6_TETPH|nr:hypothetical protein TPHA_0B03150 [Tetrapisispora phaffii CBS 4417]CCE61987.1 hypothetical protein TPHA_0B03150 [Tetrapisispora phaffii CBS 4417]
MNIFSQVGGLSPNYDKNFISNGDVHGRETDDGEFDDSVNMMYHTPLQPHTLLLKDGETTATMYPLPANPELLPIGLLAFLLDEFNMEIEKGDSFPFYEPLSLSKFKEVWFQKDGHICIMVLGEIPELDYSIENDISDLENNYGTNIETMRNSSYYKKRKQRRNLSLNIQWEKQCLGLFSLNPAYPGRSSHVVTGSFLVNAGIRGKGIGKTLVETFNEWAKRLGFTSCYFPLIYSTSVGIRRIFEVLNFKRIGKIPESGILKGFDVPVDSFIYGKEYTHITKGMDSLRDPEKTEDISKYERLIYYLKVKKYPPYCDRNEKARLRVSSKTHYLLNGKLMTKGREIIFDPLKQKQIAMEMHLVEHQGINKITSKIVERYHWKGIKNTVSEVLAQCLKCKMRHLDGTGVVVMPNDNVPQAHMLPENAIASANLLHINKPSRGNDAGSMIEDAKFIYDNDLSDVDGGVNVPMNYNHLQSNTNMHKNTSSKMTIHKYNNNNSTNNNGNSTDNDNNDNDNNIEHNGDKSMSKRSDINSNGKTVSPMMDEDEEFYHSSTLSQMAAAAVRNLQNETEKDEIIEPTPPDSLNNNITLPTPFLSPTSSNTTNKHKMKLSNENNTKLMSETAMRTNAVIERRDIQLANEEDEDLMQEENPANQEVEMNSFNRFIGEENDRRKRKYLEVAEVALPHHNNKNRRKHNNTTSSTESRNHHHQQHKKKRILLITAVAI